ncbi:MAG: hypothetical protein WAS33_10100 [Candidatus Promineifilaceae bacterium]
MRTKHLLFLLLLLLLGSFTTRPALASPPPVHSSAISAVAAQVADDISPTETDDTTGGLIIGLAGATLVIGLTAVGVLLNRRAKNNP